ncbi:MAG: hypothetical protein MUC65_00950 [Pontiellaceae bacterium]|jgi:hypothetical protein|nr:hypothetical protein [Pontiellaceae bacterium]
MTQWRAGTFSAVTVLPQTNARWRNHMKEKDKDNGLFGWNTTNVWQVPTERLYWDPLFKLPLIICCGMLTILMGCRIIENGTVAQDVVMSFLPMLVIAFCWLPQISLVRKELNRRRISGPLYEKIQDTLTKPIQIRIATSILAVLVTVWGLLVLYSNTSFFVSLFLLSAIFLINFEISNGPDDLKSIKKEIRRGAVILFIIAIAFYSVTELPYIIFKAPH